jgi:hypothetical protein
LAQWVTNPANDYFARGFANRVWKELLGRGLVEPVDGIRATNPGTHPGLLDALAAHLVDGGYRLRPLIRAIVVSATYRRSSKPLADNRADDRYYSHARHRPLAPEVFFDAVNDVLNVQNNPSERSAESRAINLLDAPRQQTELAAVSGCARADACRTGDSLGTDLATRLLLINGQLLNGRITGRGGYVASRLSQRATNEELVVELYERALCRRPSAQELEYWLDELARSDNRRATLEDFCWSLLNCQEFVTNH